MTHAPLEPDHPPPSPHSARHRAGRVLWGLVHALLFRPSPRPLFVWRVLLLRLFGAKVTWKARPYAGVKIWAPWNLVMDDYATLADGVDCYCVDTITLGRKCTVSQYSYLCGATHDIEDPDLPLVPKPITIGERVWVAADVFVAAGVTIGDGAVVGARASVFKDLPPRTLCVGSPAKPVREWHSLGGPAARPTDGPSSNA